MKWYKHISDSLDDPFIFELMNYYGSDGYLVFFGVLEIYSREFKTEDKWKLSVTQSYLTRKLHKRQSTLVIKILKHIQNSGKWEIEFIDDKVIVFIPKFHELLDDWSQRKLRSSSVVAPKILKLNKNKIKEEDKDKEKTNRGIFQIPTLQEISNYCQQRKNKVHPELFLEHYNTNGWMVGKNKMKNWKSAIITWEIRENKNGNTNTTTSGNRKPYLTERERHNQEACSRAESITRDYLKNINPTNKDIPDTQ